MSGVFTCREGLRERADASLGRVRNRLQTRFQDLLTHAADAKVKAGNLPRIFCKTSSFILETPPPPVPPAQSVPVRHISAGSLTHSYSPQLSQFSPPSTKQRHRERVLWLFFLVCTMVCVLLFVRCWGVFIIVGCFPRQHVLLWTNFFYKNEIQFWIEKSVIYFTTLTQL